MPACLFKQIGKPTNGKEKRGSKPALTEREVEVLRLVQEGLSNKVISQRLGIEVQTVKNHIRSILSKLGVQSRVAAAVFFASQTRKVVEARMREEQGHNEKREDISRRGDLFWVLSIALPAAMIIYWHEYNEVQYFDRGGVPEGKAVAAAFMIAIPTSVLLCLIDISFGVIAYRKLSAPRPVWRKLELLLLVLPLLLWPFLASPLFYWVRDGRVTWSTL